MKQLPKPKNEKERIKALHDLEILDTLSEEEFDRFTELAALICDVPISLISLIDEQRQWFKSKVGLEVNETPRDIAFCQYTILNSEILEIEDATKDERFKDNPLVKGEPNIRFYAGYPLVDAKGHALGTLCVIDEKPKKLNKKQKRSLELLALEVMALMIERRQKEELKNFEKLFQLSNDLLFIGKADGYFKKVNPAFEKVLGWNEEDLLNTPSLAFIHPEDQETTLIELKKLSAGGNTLNYVQRFRTKDHQYKTIQWTSSPEPVTGNIYGIGRDISAELLKEKQLAKSEEKLRAFFENSQGLMCTHDLNGKFLSVNTAGAKLLGYTPQEIIQLTLFDITPKERHPLVLDYLASIKDHGHTNGQMITKHKNGGLRMWIFNNILEKAIDGEIYVIGNGIDITERYYLEKDLESTKEMLEQTNKVARVGGWQFDIQKKSIYWSSVTKEIHGVEFDYVPDLNTSINFYKEGESRNINSVLNVLDFNKSLTYG